MPSTSRTALSAPKYVRTVIFQMEQIAYAEALGLSQPSVQKWEANGKFSRDAMDLVRALAKKRGIILKDTWLLTKNIKEFIQAYRRMVFNVLTHNRDDHSKNFAYIMRDNSWHLSPAYDLTFSAGVAGEHTMTIAGEGANPTKEHLLKVASKVNIDAKKAIEIIEQIKSVIANWPDYAKQAHMTKSTTHRLNKVLDNISI